MVNDSEETSRLTSLWSQGILDTGHERLFDNAASVAEGVAPEPRIGSGVSSIEAGRLHIDRVPFDLRDLIADAMQVLSARADAKGLELLADIGPGVPQTVRGDPGRLRQVLNQLVGNALKFTVEGQVSVRCNASEPRDDRVDVLIEVTDTGIGIGIEPSLLASMFEPFMQSDRSTTRTHGGTGLGLATTRRVIELMGGSIEATSQRGRGSTFAVTLPCSGRRRS